MKKRVFFLTQLKPDADVDAYERFLREVDYPRSQELLPISYYRATRIEGKAIGEGDSPFQYIEVLDIDDYDAYLAAFANPSPEVADLLAQVFSYIDDRTAIALFGEIVE
jgi:hypothetical protein